MKAEKVSDILARLVRKMGQAGPGESGNREVDWESAWSRIVGDRLRAHSHVTRMNDGVLVVRADSSAYLCELTLQKESLAKQLSAETGRRIRRLVFVM
jgi:hypothetical protein